LGVMILFAGAVREKLRTWSWRESLEAAPNCLMPDEYMVEGRFGGSCWRLRECGDSKETQRRQQGYMMRRGGVKRGESGCGTSSEREVL
jgi:hypothetical protein